MIQVVAARWGALLDQYDTCRIQEARINVDAAFFYIDSKVVAATKLRAIFVRLA